MKSRGLVLLAFADTHGDVCDLPKVIQNPGGRVRVQIQASDAAAEAPLGSWAGDSEDDLSPFLRADMDSGLPRSACLLGTILGLVDTLG